MTARFFAIFLQNTNYYYIRIAIIILRDYTLKIEFYIVSSTWFGVMYSPFTFSSFLLLLFYFLSCESIIIRCREWLRAWSKLVFPSRISQADILLWCALGLLFPRFLLVLSYSKCNSEQSRPHFPSLRPNLWFREYVMII